MSEHTGDYEVRASLPEDMHQVAQIYAHHVRTGLASFEEEAPDVSEMENRQTQILHAGLPYLVAADADTVIGFAYAHPYHTRIAFRYTLESSIYLAEGVGGRGIGTRLLGEVVRKCSGRDYAQIIAVIGDSGNIASVRLHQKLGFQHVGVLENVGYKFGHWIDAVLMQRALKASNAQESTDFLPLQ